MRAREIFDKLTEMGLKYPRGFDVFKGTLVPMLNREKAFTKVALGLYVMADGAENHTAPSD